MPAQRKIFRIEESARVVASDTISAPAPEDDAARRHYELMTEIAALRTLIAARPQSGREPVKGGYTQIARAHELKSELDLIHEAIRQTKQEMGRLKPSTFTGPQMARVGRELDEVVTGTEQATQNILKAAEDIDQTAGTVSSLLKGDYAQGLAQDIRDHVVKIFEACNFQDLTGQRIDKVVATLKFIEDHILRMQEIWRTIEHDTPNIQMTQGMPAQGTRAREGKFLNGPKLAGDAGHSSQADIDQIFDSN